MSQLTSPAEPEASVPPVVSESPSEPTTISEPTAAAVGDPSTQAPVESIPSEEPTAGSDAPPSAGEIGEASVVGGTTAGAGIVIGEIPDVEDLSVMRWTARCTDEAHDLLGHYDSRDEAEKAGVAHLSSLHPSK